VVANSSPRVKKTGPEVKRFRVKNAKAGEVVEEGAEESVSPEISEAAGVIQLFDTGETGGLTLASQVAAAPREVAMVRGRQRGGVGKREMGTAAVTVAWVAFEDGI
jgi:hypothetical protein